VTIRKTQAHHTPSPQTNDARLTSLPTASTLRSQPTHMLAQDSEAKEIESKTILKVVSNAHIPKPPADIPSTPSAATPVCLETTMFRSFFVPHGPYEVERLPGDTAKEPVASLLRFASSRRNFFHAERGAPEFPRWDHGAAQNLQTNRMRRTRCVYDLR
jgi:hypothetical protein